MPCSYTGNRLLRESSLFLNLALKFSRMIAVDLQRRNAMTRIRVHADRVIAQSWPITDHEQYNWTGNSEVDRELSSAHGLHMYILGEPSAFKNLIAVMDSMKDSFSGPVPNLAPDASPEEKINALKPAIEHSVQMLQSFISSPNISETEKQYGQMIMEHDQRALTLMESAGAQQPWYKFW